MSNSLYCSASTTLNSTSSVVASVRLPVTIDLSSSEYELGLLYTSMVPTWLKVSDLWFIHTDKQEIEDFMRLDNIPHATKDEILTALSIQIHEKYGGNMSTARVKLLQDKDNTWKLRLQIKSKLQLSPRLSNILGIPDEISNDEFRVEDFTVNYKSFETFMENSMYYISCDQCEHNFVNSSGVASNMLDYVHIPNSIKSSIIEHNVGIVKYARLEGSLLNTISFSLYNHASTPIISKTVDFYLLFHIRKVQNAAC